MIIKANRHSNGQRLANYLMDGGREGELVETPLLRGFDQAENIFEAFHDTEVLAGATRAKNPFLHVQIRLPDGEQITREQWEHTADRIQNRLGLDGQPRAAVYHTYEHNGERHLHLVLSLIDAENLKAKELPYFKFRLKSLARELEREFDITRVRNERDGPIKYAAKKNEQQQAQRLGVDKDELRNTIRASWEHSDCGRSFQVALEHEGMILAQGDRRGLVVVDYAGGVHALGKRILDVNKAAILDRLSDLNLNELPSVQQAQSHIREMKSEHTQEPEEKTRLNWDRDRANQVWEDAVINAAIEQEKKARQFVGPDPKRSGAGEGGRDKEREAYQAEHTSTDPHDQFKDAALEMDEAAGPQKRLRPIEQKLWGAYRSGPEPNDFAVTLDSHGIAFARVTGEEAYKSYREAQFAEAVGRVAPVYKEEEIVVVRAPGPEYLREGEWTEANRVHRIDQIQAEHYLEILALDKSKLKGIEDTKAVLEASADERAAYWQSIQHEPAADMPRFAPLRSAEETAVSSFDAAADIGIRTLGAALSLAENFFDGLFALLDPPITPLQRELSAERARQEREADAARQIELSRWTAALEQERQRLREQQAARNRQFERER